MLFNPYYLLFLPVTSGLSRIPGLPPSVNRKLMADFRHSISVKHSPGAPGVQDRQNTKPQKTAIYSGSLGVRQLPAGPGAPSANPHYRLKIGNIREFGS